MHCYTLDSTGLTNGIQLYPRDDSWYYLSLGKDTARQIDLELSTQVDLFTKHELNTNLDNDSNNYPYIDNIALAIPKDEFDYTYDPIFLETKSRENNNALVYFKLAGYYNYWSYKTKEVAVIKTCNRSSDYIIDEDGWLNGILDETLLVLKGHIQVIIEDDIYKYILNWVGDGNLFYRKTLKEITPDLAVVIDDNPAKFDIFT